MQTGKLTKETILLLQKVKSAILKKPDAFDMEHWEIESKCGTTHCIGGYAIALSGKHVPEFYGDAKNEASRVLELDKDQSNRLFFVTDWPDNLWNNYVAAASPEKRAKIAAMRINHFIKTEGQE